jgi:hypothetical protein
VHNECCCRADHGERYSAARLKKSIIPFTPTGNWTQDTPIAVRLLYHLIYRGWPASQQHFLCFKKGRRRSMSHRYRSCIALLISTKRAPRYWNERILTSRYFFSWPCNMRPFPQNKKKWMKIKLCTSSKWLLYIIICFLLWLISEDKTPEITGSEYWQPTCISSKTKDFMTSCPRSPSG